MASKAYELTRTIALGEAQGTYWDRIQCKITLEIPRELSKDKQQSTLIHKFENSLRIPWLSCTVQTSQRLIPTT
jgi:hypothetical protein